MKYNYEVSVNENRAKLNKDIFLFRGNRNIHYYFSIKGARFAFKKEGDLIENANAIYAAVTVIKPNGVEVANAIAPVENGLIHLKVTEDLIDEEVEVGDFDLVFDLFDDTDGAVTIPKVIGQFHVLERPCTTPISELAVATNTTNEVDYALTDYAITTYAEPVASTNEDGTFAKKTWVPKEKITTAELNRMEEGISNVSSQCKDIATKMDEISNPFNINSFTVSPSIAQKGSTINVTVKWSYNKDINSQTLNNATLDATLREKTFSSVNADVTYTLNATSTNNISKAKSGTVKFYNGIYYGKSSSTTYDSTLINSLIKVLSDSKARTITVNVGTGEYIYYCLPSRLGTPNFNVGGFDGGFDKVKTVSFTNSDGYTENYDIYKSNNANLGNTTIVVK